MVSAANGRFYSSVELSSYPANVFSVTSQPDTAKFYPPQSLGPILMQNVPDATRLGTAVKGTTWYIATSDLNGNVTPIYQFPSANRADTVIYASDGNYYGVAQNTSGAYVFRLTRSGAFTTLYSFPSSTFIASPAPLVEGSDGNLYGAVQIGGANGTGFIYKLSLDG